MSRYFLSLLLVLSVSEESIGDSQGQQSSGPYISFQGLDLMQFNKFGNDGLVYSLSSPYEPSKDIKVPGLLGKKVDLPSPTSSQTSRIGSSGQQASFTPDLFSFARPPSSSVSAFAKPPQPTFANQPSAAFNKPSQQPLSSFGNQVQQQGAFIQPQQASSLPSIARQPEQQSVFASSSRTALQSGDQKSIDQSSVQYPSQPAVPSQNSGFSRAFQPSNSVIPATGFQNEQLRKSAVSQQLSKKAVKKLLPPGKLPVDMHPEEKLALKYKNKNSFRSQAQPIKSLPFGARTGGLAFGGTAGPSPSSRSAGFPFNFPGLSLNRG